ncbi:MAG: hypothetical protein ABIQ16_20525, partial [Polyangiaceae bacterium]
SGVGRGGAVGRAGSSSAGTTGLPTSNLGAECTTDKQCGGDMVCLTPNGTAFSGGGPANGMCTLACTMTTDCTALEAGSDCFNFGTQAAPKLYCLEGCVQGGDATTAANKCQGRGDFSCVDLSSTTVPDLFCLPLCRSDLECGTGLYCNKGSGVCSKTEHKGDPVGTACTPDTTNAAGTTVPGSDNCEGFCLRTTADGVTPAKGVCAEFCAGLLDCQYTGDKPGGLCFGPLSQTFGLLDLGYCLPNCSCTDGCPFPGDVCRAWAATEQSLADNLGAPGLCFTDTTGSSELTTCVDGGGAGAGGAGAGGAGAGAGGDGGEPGLTPGGEAGTAGSAG